MLPQASPAGRGGARPTHPTLDWSNPKLQAFVAGMVVVLFLGRVFHSPCPTPVLPPPARPAGLTAAATTTQPAAPTAYLRLDETAWHPASAARTPPPTRNGLLALALEGTGVAGEIREAPRPHGAPALPAAPGLAVVVALPDVASGPAAAATLASALAGGGTGVEVVLVAASPAALTAAGALPPATRVLTRTTPPLADPASALAACWNDGVRAAKAGWAVVLAPGDRATASAWAALSAGAASHPEADVLFTGPEPPLKAAADSEAPVGGVDPLPLAPPWRQAIPPGAAFRVGKVWREGGGFPAVPAPMGERPTAAAVRAALEGGLWAAAAVGQYRQALHASSVGPEALVVAAAAGAGQMNADGLLPAALATALSVAMSGAPLTPSAVLRAQDYILASAWPSAPTREALRSAALALARHTAPRGCPATAPVDMALGLLHEGGNRFADASAAYARAATCADAAGVPALAWASRLRGDAARAAGLKNCVGNARPAAEPGSPARPASGNSKADAAECVAVLGVAM